MFNLLKKLVFSFLLFVLAFSSSVNAQEENNDNSNNFSIDLHSTYTITANHKTLVEQKFTIKNKSPELFVSKYGIVVSSTNLSNIEVSNNGQSLEPVISKQKGQTSIGVTFNEKVVGEGKTNELIISYLDEDIAQISGKILEVNIPKLSDHYQYNSYKLDLKVPSIFDTPSRITPSDFTLKQDGDYNVISYANLGSRSISAIFGNKQVFDLKLNYYLNNPSSQSALTQITLPPETPYQQVHYINLDPMPENIKEDDDGNFIATYEIPANNSFNVELFAQVMLTLHQDEIIPFSPVLPAQLKEQKFWEINSQTISQAADGLDNIKSIYDYTVNKLNYTTRDIDQNFVRLGAEAALKEANLNDATCQEFTDVFVALARKKGIPARRVVGIAYSNNEELRPSNIDKDILHTWPEYYDQEQKAWLRTDPTWEDTTGGIDYFNNFDLNHIALAVNGVSSTLPYPAGTYIGNNDEKNKKIYLDFSKDNFIEGNPDLEISLINNKFYGINLPGHYDIQILNKTGFVWYFSDIQIDGENLDIIKDIDQDKIDKILPFSKVIIPITVYNKSGNIAQKSTIHVTSILKEGQFSENEFEVRSSPQFQINDPKKLFFLGGSVIVVTLLAWSIFLLGRFWVHSLRRQGQKFEEKGQQLQEISTALKENQENDRAGQKNRISNPKQ